MKLAQELFASTSVGAALRAPVTTILSVSCLAVLAGCAHAPAPAATSAPAITAAAVAAPATPATPAPAAETAQAADSDADDEADEAPAAAAPAAKPKESDGAMSFEQLSAALGEEKLSLNVDHPVEAPAGKGLSASGYKAVAATHQAAESMGTRAGDVRITGGLAAAAVRDTIRGSAARLRNCYERGLAADPRLAGRVMVRFSVDAAGQTSGIEADSEAIPANVRSCVKDAFASMTFAAPSAPPATVTYPVDFNQDL